MAAVIAAGFFAYAGLIPLLFLLLASELAKLQPLPDDTNVSHHVALVTNSHHASLYSIALISLTLAGCIALLIPGRARWAFQLARVVLGCYVVTAVVSLVRAIVQRSPSEVNVAGGPPPSVVLLLIGALLMGLLYYFFSYGRACRLYYGLPVDGTPTKT